MENDLPVSCAYAQIALHADQVWWNKVDYGDSYKLANLNLWIELLSLNELIPADKIDSESTNDEEESPSERNWEANEAGISLPRWEESNGDLSERPLPLSQKTIMDPNWLLTQPWPSALLGSYPALSNYIKNPSNRSLFGYNLILETLKEGNHYSYTVDTLQELGLHNKIQCDSVRNIWDEEKESSKKNPEVDGRCLNADVPEFYPSVLLPPNHSPTSFPSVFDSNYESELFPYKDESDWIESGENLENSEGFDDWPEKEQTERDNKKYPRNLDNLEFSKEPENIEEIKTWLENVYPRRGYEFTNLLAVANHYENLARQLELRLTSRQPEQVIPRTSSPLTNDINQERLLYRDVLTRKISEVDENEKKDDGNFDNKFEELEREAIEQYRASDTSLVSPTAVIDLSPEQEVRFQDLEREALEQYLNCEDSETTLHEEIQNEDDNELKVVLPEPEQRKMGKKNKIDSIKNELCTTSKKNQEEKFEIPSTQFCKHESYLNIQVKDIDLEDIGRSENRSQEKTGKGKWRHKKPPKKKKTNKKQYLQDPAPSVYCLKAETRRLATALKHNVLNYLKGVDLKLTEERKKPAPKISSQKPAAKSIIETVKLSNIEDAETYRLYVKEVSLNARIYLQSLYKRVRSEIMETTSKGSVALVTPTPTDKRKVRKTIRKCVNLLNHSDNMKKAAKKMLESARRDVAETLRLLHKTMDVVYALRDMSKEAVEDVEFLHRGKEIIVDLIRGLVTIDEKSEYIKQRIIREDRSLLTVLLFSRRNGIMMNREEQYLSTFNYIVMDYSYLMLQNQFSLRCLTLDRSIMKIFEKRYVIPSYFCSKLQHIYLLQTDKKSKKWYGLEPKHWVHIFEINKRRYPVILNLDTDARQLEAISKVCNFSRLPRTRFNQTGELLVEIPSQTPDKEEKQFSRLTGVWSETLLKRHLSHRRCRSGSWPRSLNIEQFVHLEETKISKSPARNKKSDASCCLQ